MTSLPLGGFGQKPHQQRRVRRRLRQRVAHCAGDRLRRQCRGGDNPLGDGVVGDSGGHSRGGDPQAKQRRQGVQASLAKHRRLGNNVADHGGQLGKRWGHRAQALVEGACEAAHERQRDAGQEQLSGAGHLSGQLLFHSLSVKALGHEADERRRLGGQRAGEANHCVADGLGQKILRAGHQRPNGNRLQQLELDACDSAARSKFLRDGQADAQEQASVGVL
mmetsp:Transcript_65534/g.188933  ORF Transcript_65534/g.188933 Transcript_65534/m.188933 type:complete len:221 (+) Transcript_65534:3568-4230(+)